MRKKAVSAALLLSLTLPALALAGCLDEAGAEQAEHYSANIEIAGESGYKAVRLTPQVYNAANSDLSDILVKDGGGENVPYFINTSLRSAHESREVYPLELIDSYVKDDSFFFDYGIADAPDSDVTVTSIEFATGAGAFAKAVDVHGSRDNRNWDFIQSDSLYAIDGVSKLTIELDKPQKHMYYRLKLANNLERINFDSASAVYSIGTSEETFFVESISPAYSVRSSDKRTEISIAGLRNLRLCDVTIHTDSIFKRTATAPGGEKKEVFNLAFDGTPYADTAISLGRHIPEADAYVVTIIDEDDKPIDIDGVTVRYYADEVVFEGRAGETYTLEFGRDPEARAPVYDIERYKDEVLKGAVGRVSIGEISGKADGAAPERDYSTIFNIVIIAVAALLGAVILLKLVRQGQR